MNWKYTLAVLSVVFLTSPCIFSQNEDIQDGTKIGTPSDTGGANPPPPCAELTQVGDRAVVTFNSFATCIPVSKLPLISTEVTSTAPIIIKVRYQKSFIPKEKLNLIFYPPDQYKSRVVTGQPSFKGLVDTTITITPKVGQNTFEIPVKAKFMGTQEKLMFCFEINIKVTEPPAPLKRWSLYYNDKILNTESVHNLGQLQLNTSHTYKFSLLNESNSEINPDVKIIPKEMATLTNKKIHLDPKVRKKSSTLGIELKLTKQGKRSFHLIIDDPISGFKSDNSFTVSTSTVPESGRGKTPGMYILDRHGDSYTEHNIAIKKPKHETIEVTFWNNTNVENDLSLGENCDYDKNQFSISENWKRISIPPHGNAKISIHSELLNEVKSGKHVFVFEPTIGQELTFTISTKANPIYPLKNIIIIFALLFACASVVILVLDHQKTKKSILLLTRILKSSILDPNVSNLRKMDAYIQKEQSKIKEDIDEQLQLSDDTIKQWKSLLPFNGQCLVDDIQKSMRRLKQLAWIAQESIKQDEESLAFSSNQDAAHTVGVGNTAGVGGYTNHYKLDNFLVELDHILPRNKEHRSLTNNYRPTKKSVLDRVQRLLEDDLHERSFLDKGLRAFRCERQSFEGNQERRQAIMDHFLDLGGFLNAYMEESKARDISFKEIRQFLLHQSQDARNQRTQADTLLRQAKNSFYGIPNLSDSPDIVSVLQCLRTERHQQLHNLESERRQKEIFLGKLTPLEKALGLPGLTQATDSSFELKRTITLLKQKEILLPDYLTLFRVMLESLDQDINRLREKTNASSGFQDLIQDALVGPNKTIGPAFMIKKIGCKGEHQGLMELLGLKTFDQLRELEKKPFFYKFVAPMFLPSINAIFQLNAYKHIRFNGVDMRDDFRAAHIDEILLERICNVTKGFMRIIFELDFVETPLFNLPFDPEQQEFSNQPTLTKLSQVGRKYRDLLEDLDPNIIYDLSMVGYRSKLLQLDIKPKVVPYKK